MKNFGFLSKKKVAREIAKLYNSRDNTPCQKEQFLRDCEVQSALNYLCRQIGVTPMHLNQLGGGTGELCGSKAQEVKAKKLKEKEK